MSDQTYLPPSRIPEVQPFKSADISDVLRKGLADFTRAPLFGVFFAAFYVAGGLILYSVFLATGQTWWLIAPSLGFPLLAPFAAVGFYEISRRLEAGEPLDWGGVLGCVIRQKDRQIPSMAVVILIVFMFWVFVAHAIFAMFFGTQMFRASLGEMLFTPNGIGMLAVGSLVGGLMAAAFFSLIVVALPLLLDKEVDFVTAMITSLLAVRAAPRAMFSWGAVVAVLLFAGMLPLFLGLFVVLPVLGHASWHVYRKVLPEPG
jgi:uncharacterized membrane protein